MRLPTKLTGLFASVLIVLAMPATTPAQTVAASKREAILRFMRAADVQGAMTSFFKREVNLYMENWAPAVISDMETRGLFKRSSPKQASAMKALIKEFSNRMSLELQSRIPKEVITQESLAAMMVPIYDKYFSETEMNELASFCETRVGKSLFAHYTASLSDTLISHLRAKGLFDVSGSPEAESAKLDRLQLEMTQPATLFGQVFVETAKAFTGSVSAGELQELQAFQATAYGRKLSQVGFSIVTDVMGVQAKLYSSKVGQLTEQIHEEQMEWFGERTREIFGKRTTSKAGN
jgi:hypothetical protein